MLDFLFGWLMDNLTIMSETETKKKETNACTWIDDGRIDRSCRAVVCMHSCINLIRSLRARDMMYLTI